MWANLVVSIVVVNAGDGCVQLVAGTIVVTFFCYNSYNARTLTTIVVINDTAHATMSAVRLLVCGRAWTVQVQVSCIG